MVINFFYPAAYFLIYSLIGWILESSYVSLYRKRPTNRGLLLLPFCPTYGIAAIIIIAVRQVTGVSWILLLASIIVTSGTEYLVSLTLDSTFGFKFWSYKGTYLNIGGRICIYSSLVWLFLSILLLDIIHPIFEILLMFVPDVFIIIVSVVLLIALAIDAIITSKMINNLNRRLKLLAKIGSRIEHRREHIHEMLDTQLKELNKRDAQLIKGLSRRQLRLIKSYPSMVSTRFSSEFARLRKASIK